MSETKQCWMRQRNDYRLSSSNISTHDKLPVGVYLLDYNSMTNEYSLEYMSEKFDMNFKIYAMETEFMDHVMTTFNNTNRNLGILLNGTRGTGKTICAKLMSNRMNLPVILVTGNTSGLAEYLGSIPDECIIFFDEFEKSFGKEESASLLSVMDGVFTGTGRKVFMLTTNTTNIDANFMSRPSRIRYHKTFGNITRETIIDYCNDNLQDMDMLKDIIEYCTTLEIITIDILKSIVEEVNIHKKPISKIDFFNVETCDYEMVFSILTMRAAPHMEPEDLEKEIHAHEALSFILNRRTQVEANMEFFNKRSSIYVLGEPEGQQHIEKVAGEPIKDLWMLGNDSTSANFIAYEAGDWLSYQYGDVFGYVIKPFDPQTKMQIIYNDETGNLHYIVYHSFAAFNEIGQTKYARMSF